MPVSKFELGDPFEYLDGLNSYHQSEAVPGTIPVGQNLPQRLKNDLYPERISGTAFTAARKDNKQTWLYRLLPSTQHDDFVPLPDHSLNDNGKLHFLPNQTIWMPLALAKGDDFVTGLRKIGGAGEPEMKRGVAYYVYTASESMPRNTVFYSADGDLLIVAQKGTLDIQTELGHLRVRPGELCVIPRGFRYRVSLPKGPVRGIALEAYSGHFELPELGPIGSVGLANVRDFQIPKASYVDSDEHTVMLGKFCGKMYRATYEGNLFNVVGWHGTYYPFKYDLGRFNTLGSTSFDHPDPSIFTVLTCASERPGEAAADIAVFGPRWLVMENSFRPPYYHRNTMSEFSFLIKGSFDINPVPRQLEGFFNLANNMSGHGPSREVWDAATKKELRPEKVQEGNLAVMFESCYMIGTTEWAEKSPNKVKTRAAPSAPLKKAHL